MTNTYYLIYKSKKGNPFGETEKQNYEKQDISSIEMSEMIMSRKQLNYKRGEGSFIGISEARYKEIEDQEL